MGHSYVIMILLGVGLFFGTDYAFADITITTADTMLAAPGCLDTAVGCYTPNPAIASVGEVIRMINTDSGIHTFTSGTVDGFAPSPDGEFDSGILMPGDSFEFISNIPDVYPYYCTLHVWMQGTIFVVDVEVTPPPTYTPPTSNSGTLTVSGSSDLIGYEITGGTIQSIITDVDANSLIISIGATDDGSLTLAIPRSVLDALLGNGNDDDFFVLINGEEVDFDEITSSTDRILTIAFPAGAKNIEIIGTYVVSSYTPPTYTPPTYTPPTYTPPTYTPPTYPPPTYDTTPPKILKPTDITVDAENSTGARVTFDVIAIDNIDQIVRPTCNPSSGAIFSVGTTNVTCNARDSAGNRAPSISFSVTVNAPQVAIPDWIKTIASVWCDDKIADSEFISAIQYLIDNNIITVSATSGYGSSQEIPSWVKNNACWWSQNLITGEDFASGIEYLIQKGIIRV